MPSSKARAPAKVRTMGYTTEFDGSVQAIFIISCFRLAAAP
jgi:hypothetical protein